MEPVLNHKRRNKKFNKKVLLRAFKITSILLVVSIGLSIVFSRYTNKIVSKLVEELIELNSEGRYNITYASLKYDFLNQVLTLTDLKFGYDSENKNTVNYIRENQQSLFSATIPYLFIDVSDIWSVYFKKELKIKGLRIHEPSVTIRDYSESKGIEWQKDAGSLYDLISDQLQVFQINNLEVKNGYFKFEKYGELERSYSIKDISFKIDNFLLDEDAKSNKEKFFYTDDIDIELLNQSLNLKDSIHILHFKKLLLSTTKSEILVDSLVIAERQDPQKANMSTSDQYEIYIPEFKIIDVDFNKAYNEGILKIGDLTIKNPGISIADKPKKSPQKTDSVKISFSALALNYFYNIEIENFQLVDASLAYSKNTKERSQNFSLDSFNIKLTDFKLDSSSIRNESRPIYYNEIDFTIQDYKFNLPDSVHTLAFETLTGSTERRKLEFLNLSIRPRDDVDITKLLSKNKKNKTYNLVFPRLEINHLNGHEFLNSDTLIVEEVQIFDPDIQIIWYNKFENQKSKSNFEFDNLYPLIESFLNAAYLKELKMINGNLAYMQKDQKLQPVFTARNFSVDLKNIRIDTSSTNLSKLLAAESLGLNMKKAIFEDLQNAITVSLNNFTYSSETRNLHCFNVDLTRNEHPSDSLYKNESIIAREISISGFDINQFLYEKKRSLDFVEIDQPLITYHFGKEFGKDTTTNKQNWLTNGILEVEKLVIKNGEIDFKIGHEKSVKAKNIFFEVDKLLKDTISNSRMSVDNYLLKLEKFTFSDNLKYNFYSINSVQYEPTDSTLSLFDLTINKTGNTKNDGKHKITIPKFSISNWKPMDIYAKREVTTRKILVESPSISMALPSSETDPGKNPKNDLANFFSKINAHEIIVNNGKLNWRKKIEDDSVYISSQKMNLIIDGLHYDSANTINQPFLFSENVSSDLSNTSITFLNRKDTFLVADLYHSSKNSNFSMDGLFISKYEHKSDEPLVRLKLKKAFLSDFNFDKLNNREIDIGNLLMYQPEINLNLKKQDAKKANLADILMLKKVKIDTSLIKSISIDQVNLNSGTCQVNIPDSIYSNTIHLGNLEVGINDFHIDHTANNKILNSENIRIGFDGFDYHLPDSLNYLSVGRIYISVADSMLIFKDFKYLPKVGKYEYGPIVGDQTDYLNIESKDIAFIGISFSQLATHKRFIAQNLNISDLNIYAFRDKRISRKTEKIKHLPQKYLLDLPYQIDIDSISVKNANIVYEEFAEDASKPGLVDFRNLNAELVNVCNIPEKIENQPFCYLNANTLLMDEGNLEVFMKFDLHEKDYPFFIAAKLGKMDLTTFNKMLEPNAFVQVKKGSSDKLNMSANADNNVALGDMIFEYDDLKISLINKNTFENRGMGPVIGSFFANTFIINKSNPRLLITTEGEIYFERNKYRSVFNYWAKIFFSGIVSSIGAKNNTKEIKKYEKMEEKSVDSE